jgi:hypothetical protein
MESVVYACTLTPSQIIFLAGHSLILTNQLPTVNNALVADPRNEHQLRKVSRVSRLTLQLAGIITGASLMLIIPLYEDDLSFLFD